MTHDDIIKANRTAWNRATDAHQASRGDSLKKKFAQPGFSVLDDIESGKLREFGIDGKRVAQLCCNNGQETISLLTLGASEAIGFDICDKAIAEARELTVIANANCQFVQTSVYNIGTEYHNSFDIVYITIGALAWLPDLRAFFQIVSDLLVSGGQLIIYEQHPFLYLFPDASEKEFDPDDPARVSYSYFRTEPWVNDDGIDYVGNTVYEAEPSYSFTQKLSDILNAIIASGIALVELNEYGHDISTTFGALAKVGRVPMCYLLTGRKS